MEFKFEKLNVWKRAMELGEEINKQMLEFPKIERYYLSSQISRAVDSVALNISEGSIGQSNKELKRFLGYSIRSVAEVVTCLHKAKNRKYFTEVVFKKLYSDCFVLMNMLIAFNKSIE